MSTEPEGYTGPPPRAAFQGARGAFGEGAALDYFNGAVTPVPAQRFADVIRMVESGEVDYGVLPVENSSVGPVQEARAALASSTGLEVEGTLVYPIRLCLLAIPGATAEGVHRVLSHPVALGQCTIFLDSLPSAEVVAWYDTAGAAQYVATLDDPRLAAVAARGAADHYGLEVLAANIEDRPDNRTRFVVVHRTGAAIATPVRSTARAETGGIDAGHGERYRDALAGEWPR